MSPLLVTASFCEWCLDHLCASSWSVCFLFFSFFSSFPSYFFGYFLLYYIVFCIVVVVVVVVIDPIVIFVVCFVLSWNDFTINSAIIIS